MKKLRLKERKRGQEGWTLVEVLVAIIILTVGLLGVGTMQIAAIRGNFMGGNTSIALSLASQKMEDLFNKTYTHADLSSGTHGPEQLSDSGIVNPGGFYHRTWTVDDAVQGTTNWPTMKSITVAVSWENNRHSVTIQSMRRP